MSSYVWHCYSVSALIARKNTDVYYISALPCHTVPGGHNSVGSKTKSVRPRVRPRPKLQDQDQNCKTTKTKSIRPRSRPRPVWDRSCHKTAVSDSKTVVKLFALFHICLMLYVFCHWQLSNRDRTQTVISNVLLKYKVSASPGEFLLFQRLPDNTGMWRAIAFVVPAQWQLSFSGLCGTQSCCRISPPHFLAECRKGRLNRVVFFSCMFSCLFSLICVVFMCVFLWFILSFLCYCLFVSNSQVIGCEDCLWNDLYCVGWGVKLCSISYHFQTLKSFFLLTYSLLHIYHYILCRINR